MRNTPEYLILLNAIEYIDLPANKLGELVGLIVSTEYGKHNTAEFLKHLYPELHK